jgi:hypothetical protein
LCTGGAFGPGTFGQIVYGGGIYDQSNHQLVTVVQTGILVTVSA